MTYYEHRSLNKQLHPTHWRRRSLYHKTGKFLVGRGHKVDVITLKHQKDLSYFENIDGVNVYRVNYNNIQGLGFLSSSKSMLFKLLSLNKEKSYDIIHSVGEAPSGMAGSTFRMLKDVPHILTIQGGYLMKNGGDLKGNFSGRLRYRSFLKV